MKLNLSKDALLKLLQHVSGTVERRHTMAVLSNIKIEVTPETLILTASDLEVELVARLALPEGACLEAGETTVSARKLQDILKALPQGALLSLQTSEDQRCVLKSGSSRFVLGTLPATDFPLLGDLAYANHIQVSQAALKSLLDKTAFAMAVQDVRFYLTGMLFEAGEGVLRTVTTDGHRLALSETAATLSANNQMQSLQAILPRKGVVELQRLLAADDKSLDLHVGKDLLNVTLSLAQKEGDPEIQISFTSKLIDGKYPDYRRVLPRQGDKIVEANLAAFKQTLQRVSILSNEKLRGVFLHFKQAELQMRANNSEQDEAVEDLAIDYAGEPLEMSFNAQYLLDIFSVLGSESVQMTMSDANASVLVKDPQVTDSVYVVMPMRV